MISKPTMVDTLKSAPLPCTTEFVSPPLVGRAQRYELLARRLELSSTHREGRIERLMPLELRHDFVAQFGRHHSEPAAFRYPLFDHSREWWDPGSKRLVAVTSETYSSERGRIRACDRQILEQAADRWGLAVQIEPFESAYWPGHTALIVWRRRQ